MRSFEKGGFICVYILDVERVVKLGVGGESDGAELVGVAANEEGRQGLDLRGRVVDFMGGHGCDL